MEFYGQPRHNHSPNLHDEGRLATFTVKVSADITRGRFNVDAYANAVTMHYTVSATNGELGQNMFQLSLNWFCFWCKPKSASGR